MRLLLSLVMVLLLGACAGPKYTVDDGRAVNEELLMFIAIAIAIFGMAHSVGIHYLEGKLWVAILCAQAIPYLSALIGATIAARAGETAG